MAEKLGTSFEDLKKAELARDADKARKAQEQLRKSAPKGVSVGRVYADPLLEIMKRVVPESVGKDATMACFTSPPEEHNRRISEGWEPVIEDGDQVRRGNDLLYKRPKEFTERALRDVAARSNARLKKFDAQFEDAKAAGLVTEDKTEVVTGAKAPGG